MKKYSKYNKVPYIILLIIHVLLLFYTFYKNKDRKTLLVLLLSIIGFANNFEYVILVLFKAYKYIPKIFTKKAFDNILGTIFSQAIYVPSVALFITSFGLGWKVNVLFGIYFALIERLFKRLAIFKNNWWSTFFTLNLIPVYFFISDKWYEHLQKRNPIVLLISFFHIVHTIWLNAFFGLALLRTIRGGFGVYHSWEEHFKVIKIYSLFISLITTWLLKEESGWFSRIKVLCSVLLTDFLIRKWSIIKIKAESYPLVLLTHISVILLADRLRGYVYINKHKNANIT
jgi:hypothetical protein